MQYTKNQLYQIAVQSLESKNVKQAIEACRLLNVQFPAFFEGWHITAELYFKLNKPETSLLSIAHALALQPAEPRVTLQKVECLLAMQKLVEARELLLEIAKTNQRNIKKWKKQLSLYVLDKTSMLLGVQELRKEALLQTELAVSLDPKNPILLYNLSTGLRFAGKIERSEAVLDKCLALNPFDFEAQAMRSSLRKQTKESNHIHELESILEDKKLPVQGKVNICYGLAKEYDDLGEFKKSFSYLQQGAKNRRARMSYDVNNEINTIDTIKNTYQKEMFEKNIVGNVNEEAIFIIGLPRTGTTLVERILGSHSDVYAAGELSNFSLELVKQINVNTDTSTLSLTELVKKSASVDFASLGLNYINSTKPSTGHTKRFIDKLPINMLYAGLIHLALPNAKIINMTRHPMAACYAVYKQLFKDAYPFSYDLQDLAKYYIAYHRLIQHWKTVIPGVMYDVKYEDMVHNQQAQSQALLTFCDLPWQDQCLRFHENKSASTTASAAQVRLPIYNTSIDRWREYSQQLRPLQVMLEQAGISCD
ncbi:tetratricopeptide repeat-containing sulfotransferase family protein [Brumicola pallidula]|uniref:Sulfotransferase n=1 Tax=Brumicola pallidula DSM 14239 = ACAM 615 TaxID=1121922 RepID=K6YXE6_9ALTE|nr:sulfotransferase [Glaciecola pallidula]GAC28661.1 sulfotransferase [Glaciecola pallidula DSM 14239 = ACAM 615]